MWLDRLIDRLRGHGGSDQERRVAGVVYRRAAFESPAAFLEALLAAAGDGAVLDDGALARISGAVREHYADTDVDLALHVEFWRRLARRFPASAYALACHGDALLMAGREADGLGRLAEALAAEPALADEFDQHDELARRLGGKAGLGYRRARLVALLEADEPGDEVRERYSELCDEYADDAAALTSLRPVGARIRELEQAGRLPRALVRRSRPRR
jgi:hypothetical protein